MKKNMLFTSLIVSLIISVSMVSAQDTTVYVDPPSIVDPRLAPGSTFTVNVDIEDVPDLYAFDFKLGYNTKILDGVEVNIGPFLNGPTWVAKKSINEGAGVVWVAVTSWYPAKSVSGSGTLATITFKVAERGESALDFQRTKLADYDIELVPHDVEGGYFSTIPGKQCKEKWECTEWSDCIEGEQTRTCDDLNECGTEEHRPKEERKCKVKLSGGTSEASTPETQPISGAIVEILSYPVRVVGRIFESIMFVF